MMQLEFYKKRCEEMQKEHKQALIKMMPGYQAHADVSTPHSGDSKGDAGEDAALYEAEIMRLGKIVVESEQAMLVKKKELAEAIEFQKEAAKSKEGRRALAKLTHVTVCPALCLRTFIHLSACCVCTGCRVIVSAGGAV